LAQRELDSISRSRRRSASESRYRSSTTNEFAASTPKALFGTSIRSRAAPVYQYDVTPDGRRFLIAEPPEGISSSTMVVVLNWPALLKRQ
jgi:hypothetical protein